MLRRAAVGLVLCLALTAVLGTSVAAAGDVAPVTTPQGFDSSAFEIEVYENGTARWTVRHSRPLYNESQVSDFEAYSETFSDGEPEVVTRFRTRARRMVESAASALDRPMNASRFAHRATIENLGQTRGVIELSFTWSNFARRSGDAVLVDDVFGGGMYILENQRLVVQHGSGLVFETVSPTPTSLETPGNLTASRSVTWAGERQFSDGRPYVRLVPPSAAGQGGGVGDGTAPGTATPTPGATGSDVMGPMVVALVLLVALGVAGGAIWYVGGRPGLPDSGPSADAASQTATPSSETEEAAAPEPAVPEEELLSDEDRVLDLLEANGGRMKQVKIVEETEWSKSKVSMLLSEMAEDGEISKLRVGRENIISLAGNEPEAAGSPFEDE
jgi:hypothetical protein